MILPMTWQLIAIIELACFSLLAAAALWARHTNARQQVLNLARILETRTGSLDATGLLQERIAALTGSDPLTLLRRSILQHEISPLDDLADRVALAAGKDTDPGEDLQERWQAAHNECEQLAMFLVTSQPECEQPLREIFEVLAGMDAACDLPPIALTSPTPPSPEETAAHA